MIAVSHKGDFRKLERFLRRKRDPLEALRKYGERGIRLLEKATPKDTGTTSQSWGYEIVTSDKGFTLQWTNSNIQRGINIALLIQYGHATRSGTFVEGVDYINPTLKPLFKKLADDAWKEVCGK